MKFLEEVCEFSEDNFQIKSKIRISNSLLHKLLRIFEKNDDVNENKRNLIQLVYILGRLEEEISRNDENEAVKMSFNKLKEKLYNLKSNEKENKDEINGLVMAIKIILYKNRKDN